MKETMDDRLLEAGDAMVDNARSAGNFLNFSISVGDGKVTMVHSSWDFPADDLLEVNRLISSWLADEYRKMKVGEAEPLPKSESLQFLLRKELENNSLKPEEPEKDLS